MRQTGIEMQSKYKETSQGGLAVNVVACLEDLRIPTERVYTARGLRGDHSGPAGGGRDASASTVGGFSGARENRGRYSGPHLSPAMFCQRRTF